MTFHGVIFYLLALIVLVSTVLAITRRLLVHAVVYLIFSFFATGLLFYLLGSPLLAALEVIIYAGAIMVLFLFIVMTFSIEPSKETAKETLGRWLPAVIMGIVSFWVAGILIFEYPGSREGLKMGMASPAVLGEFTFKAYWFAVEIASFLLLIGLVGAYYLGRLRDRAAETKGEKS
jgi:NADH-quinone oxidoreductase subunit J